MTATKTEYFKEILKQNDLVLAPMAGVTDCAFRTICLKHGAVVMFTEMVSAKGLMYDNKNTGELMMLSEGEKNTGIQIFGSDEYYLSEAVKRYLNDTDFAFIDINMGCPVKKITSNGEGSALLSDRKKLSSVAKAICDASDKPVSAKIRIGIDKNNINCVDNAKALEDAGINLISVHGRTQAAMYTGEADLEAIKEVVEAVEIPVIGNGNVFSYEKYKEMKSVANCSGVMIARGTMGNPYLFDEILSKKNGESYSPPTAYEKLTEALNHFNLLTEYKNEKLACSEFRKHLCWYTKGMTGGAALRGETGRLTSKEAIIKAVNELMDKNL